MGDLESVLPVHGDGGDAGEVNRKLLIYSCCKRKQ